MVTCLVIDFKAGVEAQPLQQLREEIALRVSSSQFCHGAPNHKVVVVKEGVEEATGWELGLGAEHEGAGEGIAYCILGSFATQNGTSEILSDKCTYFKVCHELEEALTVVDQGRLHMVLAGDGVQDGEELLHQL